jgi:hypothetical protein
MNEKVLWDKKIACGCSGCIQRGKEDGENKNKKETYEEKAYRKVNEAGRWAGDDRRRPFHCSSI